MAICAICYDSPDREQRRADLQLEWERPIGRGSARREPRSSRRGAGVTRAYRPGAVGALMDEYERAAADLPPLVRGISEELYVRIVDPETSDEDCRSVQTIISHVVRSGYGYADYLREALGMASSRPPGRMLPHAEAVEALSAMLAYTAETLDGRWEMPSAVALGVRIQSRWGQSYDLEQMLEHAIVHVLRHRRQIERFIGR